MDSISSKVVIHVSNLRSSVDDPTESWQLMLRIVADVEIVFEDQVFYSESDFPIVELASQASTWIRDYRDSFMYISMESEVEPLIAFYKQQNGQFRPFSPHQCFEPTSAIDVDSLRNSLLIFIDDLRSRVQSELLLSIDRVL